MINSFYEGVVIGCLIIITFIMVFAVGRVPEKLDRINAAQEYRLCTQYGDAYQKWAKEKNVEVCKGF